MVPDYASLISTLALVLSIANLALILWDRRPRLKIGIQAEVQYYEDEELGSVPGGRRLWIDIANHAAKRILINSITAEWSRYFWLPLGRHQVNLSDLQRYEAEGTSRFWLEPGENAILSIDADEFEDELTNRKRPGHIKYHVAVSNGLGNVCRSNKIMLKIPVRGGKT